jgi:hypothetical protein
MTAQPSLWVEPHWTTRWPVGTAVRSTWTNNAGTVVGCDGRRLLIHWQKWLNAPDGYEAWHSSDSGIERVS